jgi:hypothetical protein
MARIDWDTYRCRRCRRSVELPHVWVKHRHALHCGACPRVLTTSHRKPPLRRSRKGLRLPIAEVRADFAVLPG